MSKVGLRDCDEPMRDGRVEKPEVRVLRNTVRGITPNFCSSTSPVVLRFFSPSTSKFERDVKLVIRSLAMTEITS
jgi:hypothetical protein